MSASSSAGSSTARRLSASAAARPAGSAAVKNPPRHSELSVAGFDDLPICADTAPALTTVRVPLREAGALAAQLVTGRRPQPPGGITTLPTELMVRASTAPPPTVAGRP
ncbi:substrate-binding domain-containing protein [Streptomyces sp. 147326]|uniref:substrate-binding domain-containing protein n=1 Tax=Streptomyces sp. 147326 TaxID=3074379 RepID=UPI00385781EB